MSILCVNILVCVLWNSVQCYIVRSKLLTTLHPIFSVIRRSRSDSRQSLTPLLIVSTDLTDVTLVSDDTNWRLDWCYSSNWGRDESYHAMKFIKWRKLSSDESYQVKKVIKWWKLSSGESCQMMKIFFEESYLVVKAI